MAEYRAIDADGHVTEFHVDWTTRLPAEFRARAPVLIPGDVDVTAVEGGERPPTDATRARDAGPEAPP
jgi:hypothetical protein